MTKVYLGGTLYPGKVKPDPPKGEFDWYCLVSFYDADRKWAQYYIDSTNKLKGFIMDSGAFSYLGTQKHKVDSINWDEYVERYADLVNKKNIDNFIELDLDDVIGMKEVERLRAKLEKLTNKQCMPVWHKDRGWEYWERMVREYDYVCVGGIALWDIKPQDIGIFANLLKESDANNCKVHGLGFTNTTKLDRYPFYSVDSSSWNSWRWGHISYFDGTKMIKASTKKEGQKLRPGYDLIEFMFNQWLKYADYMDEKREEKKWKVSEKIN